MFTDYYAENSCTAGSRPSSPASAAAYRSLEGRHPGRAGRTAGPRRHHREALKPLGYATGQFGKNHLGDRDEFLPTAHGFDEFFGNLYHLNAEEEPENRVSSRGHRPRSSVKRQLRSARRAATRRSADGKIEDTGPLTRKRMETIDDETSAAAIDFMTRQVRATRSFFSWMCFTRMHVRTHVKPSRQTGATSGNEYADGMIEHDAHVGRC